MTVYDTSGISAQASQVWQGWYWQSVQEGGNPGLKELLIKPADLSGGQRQRVAMGRAIVRDAKVESFVPPDAKSTRNHAGRNAKIHRAVSSDDNLCNPIYQTEVGRPWLNAVATKNEAGNQVLQPAASGTL